MPRRKLPPDLKKRQITVSLDPDLFDLAMATPNASAWINDACRLRADGEKAASKKERNHGKKRGNGGDGQ